MLPNLCALRVDDPEPTAGLRALLRRGLGRGGNEDEKKPPPQLPDDLLKKILNVGRLSTKDLDDICDALEYDDPMRRAVNKQFNETITPLPHEVYIEYIRMFLGATPKQDETWLIDTVKGLFLDYRDEIKSATNMKRLPVYMLPYDPVNESFEDKLTWRSLLMFLCTLLRYLKGQLNSFFFNREAILDRMPKVLMNSPALMSEIADSWPRARDTDRLVYKLGKQPRNDPETMRRFFAAYPDMWLTLLKELGPKLQKNTEFVEELFYDLVRRNRENPEIFSEKNAYLGHPTFTPVEHIRLFCQRNFIQMRPMFWVKLARLARDGS